MNYAFAPPAPSSLPIIGSDQRYPVRRVFCIARNYADHAQEMGVVLDTTPSMFFCKPADAVVADDGDVPYPQATQNFHHELEMVVALGDSGRDLTPAQAADLIWGYGVGLDLTRRDLQAKAKTKSHSWDVAKAFDYSAPISALRRVAEAKIDGSTVLELQVNGERRQHATLAEMVLPVPEMIAMLSGLFELKAGDLIFTGTPAGVAAMQRGDHFHATLQGVAELRGRIV